jgi:DNA (cytosine-5)-methyltransferase 1
MIVVCAVRAGQSTLSGNANLRSGTNALSSISCCSACPCRLIRMAHFAVHQSQEVNYAELLDSELPRPANDPPQLYRPLALDLFAGCGGLALGFEAAGFETIGFEADADACSTYNGNLGGRCHQTFLTPDTELITGRTVDVIVGGPPCQPFSVIGAQKGKSDARNGFPAFMGAVERYQPKLAIFENVRGMLYRNREYFDTICQDLRNLGYAVSWRLMNAVDFRVPQNRERLVVAAHRAIWRFPSPDRNQNRITAGEALAGVELPPDKDLRFLTESMDRYVAVYEEKSKCINPRDLYPDRPSRTVTCRNLAAATADMLRVKTADGRRRMLTEREGARLQSFPDWFVFSGPESKRFEQIGNAVAPLFGKAIGLSAMEALASPGLSTARMNEINSLNEQISLYA